MLHDFIALCAPDAAFRGVGSLNVQIFSENNEYVCEIGDLVIDPSLTTEENLILRELEISVQLFVRELPEYLRCVAIRKFWLNHSTSKIAQDLGRSNSAISHAMNRIKKKGRQQLSDAFVS